MTDSFEAVPAVVPAYIGWNNAERDRSRLRLYATDRGDSPRWDKAHEGGRVVEYAVLDHPDWGEGDRVLVVRAGNRFLSDDDFQRIAIACQAVVDGPVDGDVKARFTPPTVCKKHDESMPCSICASGSGVSS